MCDTGVQHADYQFESVASASGGVGGFLRAGNDCGDSVCGAGGSEGEFLAAELQLKGKVPVLINPLRTSNLRMRRGSEIPLRGLCVSH